MAEGTRRYGLCILVLVCFTSVVKGGIPKPVAYWPLNSQHHLKDISGNGNDGVPSNVRLEPNAEGTRKGAYVFNGDINSFIEFPNDGSYDTQYSITLLAYIYPTGPDGPIFIFGPLGVNLWQIHVPGQELFSHMWGRTGTDPRYLTANAVKQNEWNFIGSSYNYNTGIQKLWKDGKVVNSLDIGKFELKTNSGARMGAIWTDNRYFKGMITSMSVYDRELTEDEMRQIMEKGPLGQGGDKVTKPPTKPASGIPKAVANWPLNSQHHLKDISGNGNDGVPSNVRLEPNAEGTRKGAYVFNGDMNSFIEFPNDGSYDTQYSITLLAYIYPTGPDGPIFIFGPLGVNLWQIHVPGQELFSHMWGRTGTGPSYLTANAVKQNEWNFIGSSYNYNTGIQKLWKDGKVVNSLDIGKFELKTNSGARMGTIWTDNRYFKGMITCMSVYDRELTEDEVKQVMKKCAMGGDGVTTPTPLTTPAPTPAPECSVPDGLSNAATGAVATQSSTQGKAVADRAVDGDNNSDYKKKSCSKTNVESGPWWKVDLGSSRDVYKVTITNRQDCCGQKLVNAEVRVGDSKNIKDNAVCGVKVDRLQAKLETIDIICACGNPVKGRYVSVQLAKKKESLTLCEVAVFAAGKTTPVTDWTTLKYVTPTLEPATTTVEPCILPDGLVNIITSETSVEQSSTKRGRKATRAIDGNKDSNFRTGNSCSMTNKEYEPWFKLDLGKSRPIYQVVITNRFDCCMFRLKYAEIRVGDSPNPRDNPMCGGKPLKGRTVKKETVNVDCGCEEPLTGRYISIQLSERTNMLTLCEVEALSWPEAGCEIPNNVVNLASSATVSQSSTKRGLKAEKAIDGNKNSNIAGKSCTQTASEFEPWWLADLGKTMDIYKIIITNRMDCCSWRLENAEIRVGNNRVFRKNALCGSPLSRTTVDSETIEVTCDCPNALQGQYVSIHLAGGNTVLTLCEVEILGIR